MKVGVIGGGAIGLLVSSHLAEKHQVTLYVRRESQAAKINENGLTLYGACKQIAIKSALTVNMKSEDCLIVCVKQSHIYSLIPELSNADEHTPVIFLQNGMGHTEFISDLKQPLILGVVDHGALKIDDHTVSHTGKGSIQLAPFQKVADTMLDDMVLKLNQPDFIVRRENDWFQLLIKKLIINAVINPVTALFEVRNAEIIRNPYIFKIAKEICQETVAVLDMDFDSEWDRVQKVADMTGNNLSSMLKDIQENRKTELEGITGYIMKNSKGREIPYTTFIYNSIKAIERKKGISEQ